MTRYVGERSGSSAGVATRRRHSLYVALLLVGMSIAACEKEPAPGGQHAQLIEDIERVIVRSMQRHNLPGAAVALIEEGEVAWVRGFGVANRADGRTMNSETMFNVASVSKPITALGIMRLAEQGKLDLDAPVSKYLKRWSLPAGQFDADEVTARRILSHTAGLSMPSVPAFEPREKLPSVLDILNGEFAGSEYSKPGTRVEILYPPGEEFHYSGGGYVLLELLVEDITGKRFRDYMRSEVLIPLGMMSGRFGWDEGVAERLAVPYGHRKKREPVLRFPASAGSGLYTGVSELATLLASVLTFNEDAGGGVVSPEGMKTMFEAVVLTKGRGTRMELPAMALGFFVSKYPKLISHMGGNLGWRSRFLALPESGQGIVVLTNSDRGSDFINDVVCTWLELQLGATLIDGC